MSAMKKVEQVNGISHKQECILGRAVREGLSEEMMC